MLGMGGLRCHVEGGGEPGEGCRGPGCRSTLVCGGDGGGGAASRAATSAQDEGGPSCTAGQLPSSASFRWSLPCLPWRSWVRWMRPRVGAGTGAAPSHGERRVRAVPGPRASSGFGASLAGKEALLPSPQESHLHLLKNSSSA